MITEKELVEAIQKCEKEPFTPNKISMLASLYIIYEHLFGNPAFSPQMSYAEPPAEHIIHTSGDTEFLSAINGQSADKIIPIFNELVEAVKILHPRMYQHLLEKLYNE